MEDVVSIYIKLLKIKGFNIFDVGTENGTRIKEIIDKLKYTSENIIYVKGKILRSINQ